ncbi:MAG: hypothetical protein AUK39_00665 [Dehalococcoidia bacterium CG2_30_46_19]|nr:MAG: hypothetical protein AUK39_00665 [Dehalococcoidia bacterium CG2_30_46_19]
MKPPRGELIHYIRSNGTDHPERLKVRAPTLGNIPAVLYSLKGGYIADIPIVFAAIDPCLACMDRVILLDVDSGRRRDAMSWKELREYGIRWHANKKGRFVWQELVLCFLKSGGTCLRRGLQCSILLRG